MQNRCHKKAAHIPRPLEHPQKFSPVSLSLPENKGQGFFFLIFIILKKYFETRSYYVAHAGLELATFLPQSSEG